MDVVVSYIFIIVFMIIIPVFFFQKYLIDFFKKNDLKICEIEDTFFISNNDEKPLFEFCKMLFFAKNNKLIFKYISTFNKPLEFLLNSEIYNVLRYSSDKKDVMDMELKKIDGILKLSLKL